MTTKRMSLVDSFKRDQEEIDPMVEKNFLKYGTATPPPGSPHADLPGPMPAAMAPSWDPAPNYTPEPAAVTRAPARRPKSSKVSPVGLIPVTIRLRPEIAGALKRASLERQLSGEEPFTQQDIVEQALEPWLREEGYLE